MKTNIPVILCLAYFVWSENTERCKKNDKLTLQKGLTMKCTSQGKWVVKETKGGSSKPCEDNLKLSENGTCTAERGHCSQFTKMGVTMDRDCPETCESCDVCHCQDDHQWHKYCPFWQQYCHHEGVLGTWMTSNCKKTCGKCKCKCCSYKGKQHKLGTHISLPEHCAELVCEEGLIADPSPLIMGAVAHGVSHPEELTLNFRVLHHGMNCCILPGNGTNIEGSFVGNGTMVSEGWRGTLNGENASVQATCCHGILCMPIKDVLRIPSFVPAISTISRSTTTSTSTTSTTSPTSTTSTISTTSTASSTSSIQNDGQCSQSYTILNQSWRKAKYVKGGQKPCTRYCDRGSFSIGWYRFVEPAGYKLPITSPGSLDGACEVCQTNPAAWVEEGRDPVIGEGIMNINLCFSWYGKLCGYKKQGRAVACKDDQGAIYYLYYLPPVHQCDLGYCALGA